jgi:hypothetical protein
MRFQCGQSTIAALLMATALLFSAALEARADLPAKAIDVAKKPTYTENEFRCMALVLWHEGGSSFATLEELKLMGHTILVRSRAKDWYQRRDWGSPDICTVVHKKDNGVCQYTYYCTRHAHEAPVSDHLWKRVNARTRVAGAHPTARGLWNRTKRAAREVLGGWTPQGALALADTYVHKCSTKFAPPGCSPRLVDSQVAKCWFALEEVLIPGQAPVPANWKHVYYRRKTLAEVKAAINSTPPACTSDDARMSRRLRHEVTIVHEAEQDWIDHPDRSPLVAQTQHERRAQEKRHEHTRRHFRRHRRHRRH